MMQSIITLYGKENRRSARHIFAVAYHTERQVCHEAGRLLATKHVLPASGAWMRQLRQKNGVSNNRR